MMCLAGFEASVRSGAGVAGWGSPVRCMGLGGNNSSVLAMEKAGEQGSKLTCLQGPYRWHPWSSRPVGRTHGE